MRAVFGALDRYDIEKLMTHWAEDATYDNPMVGPPATGKATVREQLSRLIGLLRDREERLIIDRTTEGPGHVVVVEWHVEPGDGNRRGVHVAEVGGDALIRSVTVYPRL